MSLIQDTQNCYKMFKITIKLGEILDKKTQRLNKARKKFIRAFVLGLIEKGSVEFTELVPKPRRAVKF